MTIRNKEHRNAKYSYFWDIMPQRQGSGASLRYYSNVRAYLDLDLDVDVVQIATEAVGLSLAVT